MDSLSVPKMHIPLSLEQVMELVAGQWVQLTGEVLLARDATHQRMVEDLDQGRPLPVSLSGAVVYYAGPTPALPGRTIGSIGPTTAQRMDRYLPLLFDRGVRATIGKGERSPRAFQLHQRCRTLYLLACGGASAYLSQFVSASEIIAYEELGPQALRRIHLEALPVLVAYDARGGNVFRENRKRFMIG